MPEINDQKFANIALDAGLITAEMVSECIAIQKRQKEMGYIQKSLKELLVEKGYIDDSVARKISRGEQAEDAKKKEKIVRIGGYEVISRLGKGQMGSVYKARQVSLDRIVALKVLPSRLAGDKRYLQRFLREAKSAGKLNHPNIVTAVEFGESNGLYYYAMDYVEGVNIKNILEEEGSMSEDEALAITLQMARALEHAHENNIVHRDVKPDNIMVDSEGRSRLCDLGLAREANEDGALTQAGIVLGTPYYISPEQAEGRRDLDTRSDIYSLGVTLFHMVTGRVPFQGNTGPAIMVKHINEKMPDPREFNEGLSNGTVQLIKKMTAKNREQRYQDPTELVDDIERVIKGERPAAAGPVIRARKRRAPGAFREEVVVTGGGNKLIPLVVVGAIVVIVIVAISSMSGREKPARRRRMPVDRGASSSDRTAGDASQPYGDASSSAAGRTARPGGSLPVEQKEIMELMEWARTNQDQTAEIARKYGEFIETASNPEALKTARQALEGVATREHLKLQRKFESLLAMGKTAEAIEASSAYLKMFGKTKAAARARALLDRATKERDKAYDEAIGKAMKLAGENKYDEALETIAETAGGAPEELKPKFAAARKKIEKARKDYIAAGQARALSTRGEYEKRLAVLIEKLELNAAVALINSRLRVEVEPQRIEALTVKAADIKEAVKALELIMANLKNLEGLKQTFNIDRKGDEQGTVEKVKERSFIFASGAVTREVRINHINSADVVRLAQLELGPEPAKTRNRLGLLFLLVLDDPQEARRQFAKAGELGMDTSRFEEKIAVSRIKEALDKAEAEEKKRRYFEAALAYSEALEEMEGQDSYAAKIKEVKTKIDVCLRESGMQKAFAGKVALEKGLLSVSYDFSDPVQWTDFEGYIWDARLKREKVTEWIVDGGAMVGKGSEGVIWKGKFAGDVSLEVDAIPKEPAQPIFFIRLCDDGRGFKGRNYSFGFGHWTITKTPVGRRGKQIVYREVKSTPEHYIAKWRGSSKKYIHLARGATFPQIKPGQTFKVKIQREGESLRVFIDGTKILETEDKDNKKGCLSLKVVNSTVHFDNMKITGEFDASWLKSELRKAK